MAITLDGTTGITAPALFNAGLNALETLVVLPLILIQYLPRQRLLNMPTWLKCTKQTKSLILVLWSVLAATNKSQCVVKIQAAV